jgi:hypothetical protein
MNTKSIIHIATIAALALLTAAAPAAAKPVAYKGKTKAGHAIVFKRAGNSVSGLRAYVPVMCVSTRTSDTRAGAEAFTPPGLIRIGGEQAIQAELPVSMGMGDTATKNFHVTLRKGRRGAISGKLDLNFMAIEPYFNSMGYLDGNTFVCQGSTTFSARPR